MAFRSIGRPGDSTLRRNLLFDATAWVGFGVTSALLGSMLPAIARREGIDPIGIAVLAAIPYAASLLGVMAGRIGPRVPAELAVLRAIGAAALALVLVGPGIVWVVVAASLFWIAHFFAMPTQQRLWSVIYPEASRGRLISTVSTARWAAAGIALLVGGLLASQAEGAVIVAAGGIVGAILALASARITTPDLGAISAFSIRRALRSVLEHPRMREVTFAHMLFGGGMAVAVPLITLVQVDRLGLDLAAIGLTGMVGAVATLGSLMAWGAIADRRGMHLVLEVGGILGVVGLSLFAVAADHLAVLGASVLVGLSNGAIEVAFVLMITNHLPASQQAAAAAGTNAIFGMRGLIAPLVVVALVQVGIIDVDGALALCVAASVAGALLYMRAAGALRLAPEGQLARAPGRVLGRVRRGRVTVSTGGHAIASALGSRFASLR